MNAIIGYGLKLYYKSKIEGIVGLSVDAGEDKSHALNVPETVKTVFDSLALSTTLEKYKKKAIKSVLKDRITAYKAQHLDSLLETVRSELGAGNVKDLNPEELENLTRKIQSKHPQFKPYEIRFVLQNRYDITNKISGLKLLKEGIDHIEYKDGGDRKKRNVLASVHDHAKAVNQNNKSWNAHIDPLFHREFSEVLGISSSEIDKEIYRLCFDLDEIPENLSLDAIRKALATVPPDLKIQKYKPIAAFARLMHLADKITPTEAALFNKILALGSRTRNKDKDGNMGGNMNDIHILAINEQLKAPALDLLTEFHQLLATTTNQACNNSLYDRLNKKLIEKWNNSTEGEILTFAKQLGMASDPDGNPYYFARLNKLPIIKMSADYAYLTLIRKIKQAFSYKFENKKPIEVLQILSNEFNVKRVNLIHVLAASELPVIGKKETSFDNPMEIRGTNRLRLFALLNTIPDENANNILAYLKNPEENKVNSLSIVERGHLAKLFLTIRGADNIVKIEKEQLLADKNRDKVKKLLPARKEGYQDLDIEIIELLFQKNGPLLLELFAEGYKSSIDSFNRNGKPMGGVSETSMKNAEGNNLLPISVNSYVDQRLEELARETETESAMELEHSTDDNAQETRKMEMKALNQFKSLGNSPSSATVNLANMIADLEMTDSFRRENAAAPMTSYAYNNKLPIIIPERSKDVASTKFTPNNGHPIELPLHIGRLVHLKEIAGNDDELFFALQSLSTQTLPNSTFQYIKNTLKEAMNIHENDHGDTALDRIQLAGGKGAKEIILTKTDENTISSQTRMALTIKHAPKNETLYDTNLDDTNTDNQAVPTEIVITSGLRREGKKWVRIRPSVIFVPHPTEVTGSTQTMLSMAPIREGKLSSTPAPTTDTGTKAEGAQGEKGKEREYPDAVLQEKLASSPSTETAELVGTV